MNTCPECMQPMDDICYDCGVFYEKKTKFELTVTSDIVKKNKS